MAIKCAVDVKKDIISKVNKTAVVSRAFSELKGEPFMLQVNNARQANIVANQINRDYKEGIVKPSYSDPDNFYTIEPSDRLVDRYLQSHLEYLQTSTEQNSPKFSPETLKKAKLFIERAGVDVKKLDKMVDSTGQTISANGRANLLKGLIEVVRGKEDIALPEEAMHFAVAIVKENNRPLFNSMLSKVGDFQLYKDIINDNSENSYRNIYKTPDGKPDIIKIKEEVMGKLLAQSLNNIESEKTYPEEKAGIIKQWWDSIKNFLSNLFSKASNIDPFDTLAKKISQGKNIGKASDIKGAELFYSRNDAIIKANMKLVGALNLPQARLLFDRFYQKGQKDIFFNKLTSDLQAPKNQVEILKQWVETHHPSSVDDMITGIASEMSYVIEINTGKIKGAKYHTDGFPEITERNGRYFTIEPDGDFGKELTKNEYDEINNQEINSNYNSNLTVGPIKNYVEKEITVPGITPSIKNHAAFATDNGIGHYRAWEYDSIPNTLIVGEVQSDLFQKGRNKEFLTNTDKYDDSGASFEDEVGKQKNQFLQLLNKDNNWVTVFIKSIIQDSAKKGYENILFPTGNTASKVEGHSTLEEFKKQKEDRIKELESNVNNYKWTVNELSTNIPKYFNSKKEADDFRSLSDNQYKFSIPYNSFGDDIINGTFENLNPTAQDEINQLKEELERVDREGFGALKPIYKFYEENVTNILKKIGKIEKYTDKYGNTWNKYTISDKDKGEFYYQLDQENPQDEIDKKLANTQKQVIKDVDNDEQTGEELSNEYKIAETGRVVKDRVTNLVPKPRNYNPTDKQKRDNEVKRSNGVSGHLDFQRIIESYVDPLTHNLRPTPIEIDSESAIGNRVGFERMKSFIQDLISQHSTTKDENGNVVRDNTSKFYTEEVIYDEKKDRAGTIDFLIVDKDGKASIYDWKFLSISKGENDIPWYKQDAATTQIREYRRILKDSYGVKSFGETRAIPIVMEYYTDYKSAPFLVGMNIGSADTSKIQEVKYLPIPVDEQTGIPALDAKIKQLVNQYDKAAKKPAKEGRKDIKNHNLNTLKQAIRILRSQANLYVFKDTMEVNATSMQNIVDDYNNNIKGKNPEDLSNQQKSDFAYSMKEQLSIGDMYKDLDISFDTEIRDKMENGELTPEQASDLRTTLNNAASKVRINMDKLKKIQEDFARDFVAKGYGVNGLLDPEKIFRGFWSPFTGMAKIPIASVQVLFQAATEADENARMDALEMNERVFHIRRKVLDWAKSRGMKDIVAVRKIYKKDTKGKRVHELIDKINPSFKKELKENAEKGNRHWFDTNIDLEGYKKDANAYLQERKDELSKVVYSNNAASAKKDETEEERIKREKDYQEYKREEEYERLENKYNIDSPGFENWDNFIMERHIKDEAKWYTSEYKEIANTPLEELYNEQVKSNKLANDIGYLDAQRIRTFTPFLRKTITDKMIWGGNVKPVQDFIDDMSIGDNPSYYGEFDENGNVIPSIPKYYTSDTGEEKTDEKGNKYIDYSGISEDPFKNLIAFNTQIQKYKYFSEVEGMVDLLKSIEEFKGHLQTDRFGNVSKDTDKGGYQALGKGDSAGNIKNFKLLDDFVNTVIYKQKYAQSTTDSVITIGMKNLVNKVAGREVFKGDVTPTRMSLIKNIDAINKGVRMKVLSLNFLSGIAVAFGNNLQVAAQTGEYFTYRNYLKNQNKILRQDFQTEKSKELFTAFINAFLPLDKDLSTELYNKSGVRSLSSRTIGDMLMILMSKPDEVLEKSVFLSLLDNLMVHNGQFVNINNFVKAKYPNRNNSAAERNQIQPLIEKEIAELKKTSALSKVGNVDKEGKLVIPGFDVNDRNNRKELIRVAQLSKTITRNANGNVSEFNKNQTQMNVFSASAMVFRNWIPSLTSTRFAGLHKTADSFEGARYDIGRVRLMGRLLMDSITSKALLLSHVLTMNDKGLNYINSLFEKYRDDYESKTGKKFEMDKNDFIDLIHNNIRNEAKEISFLIGLCSAMLALGAMAPSGGDKQKKNLYSLVSRTFDKMQNEITYFYDPRSVFGLTNAGIFPSASIFTDVWKFGDSVRKSIFDDAADNKRNSPLKNFLHLLPVSSSWITYVGVIDPDLAKYLQVNLSSTIQSYQ